MGGRSLPRIAFRDEDASRPWVVGSGLDVWEICQMVQDFGSVANVVAETHLSEPQVRLALAYRKSHLAEVEQAIEENSRPLREWRELFPFVRTPAF